MHDLFRSFLHKYDIFIPFVQNTRRYHHVFFREYLRQYVRLYRIYHDIPSGIPRQVELYSDLVDLGFDFHESPEGAEYWQRWSNLWNQYLHNALYPPKSR